MAFGGESTLRLRRPSFRQNLIEDMQKVVAGQSNGNFQLLNQLSTQNLNVQLITHNGSFIATVGISIVGSGDIVGIRKKLEVS